MKSYKLDTIDGPVIVSEHMGGLDVHQNDIFLGEISGRTFSDYSYDGKIDDDKLLDDIYNEIDMP